MIGGAWEHAGCGPGKARWFWQWHRPARRVHGLTGCDVPPSCAALTSAPHPGSGTRSGVWCVWALANLARFGGAGLRPARTHGGFPDSSRRARLPPWNRYPWRRDVSHPPAPHRPAPIRPHVLAGRPLLYLATARLAVCALNRGTPGSSRRVAARDPGVLAPIVAHMRGL